MKVLPVLLVFSIICLCLAQTEKIITDKITIIESSTGSAYVRVKEHYGGYKIHENVVLLNYDKQFFYIGRFFQPTIVLPISRWAIDSIWVAE